METQDNKFTETTQEYKFDYPHHSRSGRFMGGLIIVAVGVVWLLNQLHSYIFPQWLFTWPMFLIVLGLFIGARRNFRFGGWPLLMLIGGIFLAEEIYPNLYISDYVWPCVIIAVGLLMILRPRRRRWWGDNPPPWSHKAHRYYQKYGQQPSGSYSQDDYIDCVSVFGGIHKIIVSKDFKGGDTVNIFGGAEINLSQADIKGKVVLDVVQIFGGARITVPSDWTIQSKMVSVFGGVEDKRTSLRHNPDKVLVIDGVSIFAGIDIIEAPVIASI